MTSINLKCILEGNFDYSTLNHKSPTPSPNLSLNQSPKHTLLPFGESIDVQNQLILFSTSEQPLPLNTMLEPPIDVSYGKASSYSSESEYDEVGFDAHLNLKTVKPSLVIIKPIQAIHIQTFSP